MNNLAAYLSIYFVEALPISGIPHQLITEGAEHALNPPLPSPSEAEIDSARHFLASFGTPMYGRWDHDQLHSRPIGSP